MSKKNGQVTTLERREMRQLRRDGNTIRFIATAFNRSRSTVRWHLGGTTPMTEAEAFVAGWQARGSRDIREIEELSAHWRENGPPKAAAHVIIKQIMNVPDPIPENGK